jgi:imidazole glycerol phosphate synthase glutamine amidotransferase subunit
VQRFSPGARVPHMGWNQLEQRPDSHLLRGIAPRSYVYFAHSYYVPENSRTAAACTYEVPYTAALEAGNVFGVQFHPEKSGPVGLRIVRKFLEV